MAQAVVNFAADLQMGPWMLGMGVDSGHKEAQEVLLQLLEVVYFERGSSSANMTVFQRNLEVDVAVAQMEQTLEELHCSCRLDSEELARNPWVHMMMELLLSSFLSYCSRLRPED